MKLLLAIFIFLPSICPAAELLVKAVDATHIDPVQDKQCYKSGDIVVAMPDGHQWGREEGPPKFYVVKVAGLSVEEAKAKYLQSEWAPNELNGEKTVMVTRRIYKFDEQLAEGEKEVSKEVFEEYALNKKTGKKVKEEKIE